MKLLETCRVAPPPNTAAQKSLPLTFMDVIWVRFHPTQRLFFYEIPKPTSFLLEFVVPKLKQSLSLTLHHFPPIAGNLVWPPASEKPFISVDEDGSVSVTVAESNANFYRLSGDEAREAADSHPLLPHWPASDERAPVLALQITLFPNRGLCIGIASNHAVMDGKTTTMFMKSWALICRLGGEGGLPSLQPELPPELTPVYDRTLLKDTKGLESIFLNAMAVPNKTLTPIELKPPTTTELRATFTLTVADIAKLRELVSEKYNPPPPPQPRLSTFVLTCAYVWVCLVKAEEVKNENVYFPFAADLRARLDPPVPGNYFGNCVGPCFVDAKTADLTGEDGVVRAAESFNKGIERIKSSVLKGAEKWFSDYGALANEKFYSIAGSPQFELYNTDFGWGRPRKMEITSIDRTGAIALADGRDGGGGVEVGLVLAKHKMEAFSSLFIDGLKALRSINSR